MIKIAITGPSGSGKSTLLTALSNKGIPIIDCDVIVHEIQQPGEECYYKTIETFGTDILNEDKTINRKVLARIVFSKKNNTVKLNSITHGFVLKRIEQLSHFYSANGSAAVLIEAGALFESGLDKKCDKIVLLTANEHLLVDRICKRDHIDKDNAVLRLKAQMDIDYVKARSNLVLFNDGDIQILDYYCDLLLRKIKEWEL